MSTLDGMANSGTYPNENVRRFAATVAGAKKRGEEYKLPPILGVDRKAKQRFYIPILRGMRPYQEIEKKDPYLNRTVQDYFDGDEYKGIGYGSGINQSKNSEIITGLHLYELLTRNLFGQPHQRQSIHNYQKLLSQYFFEGKEVELIPAYKQDTIEIQIGKDAPQLPIYKVGDGLQQILIITSAAYLSEEPSLFFIEEPEQSLHPGLLRELAIFLIKETEHQYFVTTHSNHLLDLMEVRDEVTVHRFKKPEETGKFSITEYAQDDRSVFVELGVRPSSVYLSNSTIWVEGITDRLYLRVFMQRYIDDLPDSEKLKAKLLRLIENYHYAFVEYQGGNLVHWNFDDDDIDGGLKDGLCAMRVSAKAFLICDGDIVGKAKRKEVFRAQLKENLYVWRCKEIENALPRSVIINTAKTLFTGMTTKKLKIEISKLDETEEGYFYQKSNGIGYLLNNFLDNTIPAKKKILFADSSGTIYNKQKFCNEAIRIMKESPESWEMPSAIKVLCKKIYDHILRENQIS
ncbi:MAG: AAA family ATPase [Pseudomonadota bacterium]